MTDKKMYKLINKFINNTSIVNGGDIDVVVTVNRTSMKPNKEGMKYEDCLLINELLRGSESFLFWLRRNGYDIVKKRKQK